MGNVMNILMKINKDVVSASVAKRNGYTQVPNWVIYLNLTPQEFIVFIILLHHLPNVFPSIDRIASLVSFKRRHVTRILNQLEEKDLIHKKLRTGKSTRYAVRIKTSHVPQDMGVMSCRT